LARRHPPPPACDRRDRPSHCRRRRRHRHLAHHAGRGLARAAARQRRHAAHDTPRLRPLRRRAVLVEQTQGPLVTARTPHLCTPRGPIPPREGRVAAQRPGGEELGLETCLSTEQTSHFISCTYAMRVLPTRPLAIARVPPPLAGRDGTADAAL